MPSGVYIRTDYHKNILKLNGNSGRFKRGNLHRGWKDGIAKFRQYPKDSEEYKKYRTIYLREYRHRLGISKRYNNGEHNGFSYTKEYRKEYRIRNKEHRNRLNQLWKKSPKGKLSIKQWNAIHRAKTKDLTIQIVQQVYEDNIKRFGTLTCYLCLNPIPFGKDHLEHKVPLSRGGTNIRNNLEIACSKCNYRKFTKTEAEYKKGILNL